MIGDMGSTARGSGARLNTGKPNLSLIPLGVLDDAARVFEYGMHKYAKRRGCTCSVANAFRTNLSSDTPSEPYAGPVTTVPVTPPIPNFDLGASNTPWTTLSGTSPSGEPSSESTPRQNPPSESDSSSTSARPMDLPSSNTMPSSLEGVVFAEPQTSASTLTTTTTLDMSEVPFATLVTSGSASWRDLMGGLTEHSSTCGLRDADLSTGLWNWAKGMKWSVVLSSLLRHVSALQMGELLDPESELPHTGHMMCNIIMLCHYYKFFPDLNDFNNANLLAYTKEPTNV